MKTSLVEILICPRCLPREVPLAADIQQVTDEDIDRGTLVCPHCRAAFPIKDGIAYLDPLQDDLDPAKNKYEQEQVVSAYLWSHYGDLFDPEHASDAYKAWADLIMPVRGMAMDAGGAVGRFTFEMSCKCDFAVGVDNSVAFIRAARSLMRNRQITFHLKDEGTLTREASFALPECWESSKVEFIVGNALALPFCRDSMATFASLNLVDKVPSPLQHLQEMDRVVRQRQAQCLLSDPFSWSEETAPPEQWLGGTTQGRFAGKGRGNIISLLTEENGDLCQRWQLEATGKTWWKIRNHTNHYELIQSCYLTATR